MDRFGTFVYVTLISNLHYTHQELLKPWPLPSMRYVDRKNANIDLFFDRIVFLTVDMFNFRGNNKSHTNIATGVLISDNMVLTTYNPFRNLTKFEEIVSKIYVCYMTLRQVEPPYITGYDYMCATVACGRQVIPVVDDELPDGIWHDPDKVLSPLHDLMVLRLDDTLEIWTPEKDYTYEERHSEEQIKAKTVQQSGPLLTNIAGNDDNITLPIKFVSMGFKSNISVLINYILESVEYNEEDNIIVDCEDWLPREWGYFICLWNDPEFSGFGSGAMLFSNKTLFGIGSFALFRGKDSILVFTDVRPYNELLINTCIPDELILEDQASETTTLSS